MDKETMFRQMRFKALVANLAELSAEEMAEFVKVQKERGTWCDATENAVEQARKEQAR